MKENKISSSSHPTQITLEFSDCLWNLHNRTRKPKPILLCRFLHRNQNSQSSCYPWISAENEGSQNQFGLCFIVQQNPNLVASDSCRKLRSISFHFFSFFILVFVLPFCFSCWDIMNQKQTLFDLQFHYVNYYYWSSKS